MSKNKTNAKANAKVEADAKVEPVENIHDIAYNFACILIQRNDGLADEHLFNFMYYWNAMMRGLCRPGGLKIKEPYEDYKSVQSWIDLFRADLSYLYGEILTAVTLYENMRHFAGFFQHSDGRLPLTDENWEP